MSEKFLKGVDQELVLIMRGQSAGLKTLYRVVGVLCVFWVCSMTEVSLNGSFLSSLLFKLKNAPGDTVRISQLS